MKSKTITLCASASFYKGINQIKEDLIKLGFIVLIPHTASIMQKNNDFNVAHFKKIVKGDSILVINNTKHGVKGYIGGNVLMEMAIAYFLNKKIYVLNAMSKKLSIYEEVMGLSPTILNGDITKVSILI